MLVEIDSTYIVGDELSQGVVVCPRSSRASFSSQILTWGTVLVACVASAG